MCVGHFEFTDLPNKLRSLKPKKHFLTIKCDFYFLVELFSTRHQSGNSLHDLGARLKSKYKLT
jgi:hypothetical protein